VTISFPRRTSIHGVSLLVGPVCWCGKVVNSQKCKRFEPGTSYLQVCLVGIPQEFLDILNQYLTHKLYVLGCYMQSNNITLRQQTL